MAMQSVPFRPGCHLACSHVMGYLIHTLVYLFPSFFLFLLFFSHSFLVSLPRHLRINHQKPASQCRNESTELP